MKHNIEIEAETFEYEYFVQEKDLDIFGHVNNANYFRIYEMARWDFITKNGFGLERIQKDKKGPVLLESKARFRRELKNRDVIKIYSQAESFTGRFLTLRQTMKREGKMCSEATFLIAYFDLAKRKLANPDLEWLKACGVTVKEDRKS